MMTSVLKEITRTTLWGKPPECDVHPCSIYELQPDSPPSPVLDIPNPIAIGKKLKVDGDGNYTLYASLYEIMLNLTEIDENDFIPAGVEVRARLHPALTQRGLTLLNPIIRAGEMTSLIVVNPVGHKVVFHENFPVATISATRTLNWRFFAC